MGSESSTAYMCIVDDEGLAVSIIQSNFEGTGSAFGAGRSGFLLHNRGSGFSLTPGHPNELQPGKRPLHTLSPTLWTRDREPKWVIGTRGGSVQPQLVAQVAARAILAGKTIEEAQTAPRWVVREFGPSSEARLLVEHGIAGPTLTNLRARGHVIEEVPDRQPGWGPVSMIKIDGKDRTTHPDPRVDTTSAIVF
jgi:gamma-glutamyltranspeptidase/glutathione hydrolase